MAPGRGGRGGGKRKRVGGQGGPGRGGKKEKRDKSQFKMRKYTRNNYVIEEKKVEEPESDESPDEEQSNYDQLLQVLNTKRSEVQVASDESSDDDEHDEDGNEEEEEGEDVTVEEEQLCSNDEENVNDDTDGEESDKGEDITDFNANNGIDEEEEETEDGDVIDYGEEEDDEEGEGEDEGIEDDLDAGLDPFSGHFEVDLSEELAAKVKQQTWKVDNVNFPLLGTVKVQTLDLQSSQAKRPTLKTADKMEKFQEQLMSLIPTPVENLDKLHLKKTLRDNIQDPQTGIKMSDLSCELLSLFSSYKDVVWNERTHQNGEELRLSYTVHALNHVLKTRTKILNNNQKHEKREDNDEALRDQGLCRPKVLIVVPFRESCRRVVNLMEKLLFPHSKGNVANKKKFSQDYPNIETARKGKSDEYYETFAGDINDSFKLGIAVTKKTLKLFTDFYNSDIIIASPLGLRLVIGAEGDQVRNYDFLNSIELMIFDQTEIFMMQNWDHILSILDDIHKQPQESRGADYSRVRLWTLDGLNKYYRQSLLFSSTPCPEINAVLNRDCFNYFGKARVVNPVNSANICKVLSDVSLVFNRVDASSPKNAVEERFRHFKNLIKSKFMKDNMDHVMVFFSSYVDFVKARNWFKSSDFDFAEVSEYTKDNKMAKARDDFYHNGVHFLLYTERAHFYRRFSIKGIRHLIFFQMPLIPVLMTDLCNLQQEQFQNKRGGSSDNMSCTILYTKYDASRLAQCVGTEKASTMVNAANQKHVFTPGS